MFKSRKEVKRIELVFFFLNNFLRIIRNWNIPKIITIRDYNIINISKEINIIIYQSCLVINKKKLAKALENELPIGISLTCKNNLYHYKELFQNTKLD